VSWPNSPAAARYSGAAIGGVLLSLSFAPAELAGAAWIAPGLILFCALGAGRAQSFRIGFVGGLAHFLSSLYWLLAMPFDWHGIPLAPGLAWILLSAYCALFIALWVWFCWKILPKASNAAGLSFVEIIDNFLSIPVWKRAAWAIACACAWTALEFARGLFLTGFPWNFLGDSQYRLLPIIQVASITGVYGVTFLVVWFSVAICSALLVLGRNPGGQRVWLDVALPLLVLGGDISFGMTKCLSAQTGTRRIKVALVQPSIPQTLIFDPSADSQRFQDVIALSKQALEANPDLMVWPESAIPALNEENQRIIAQLLASHPVWTLFCADSADILPSGATAVYNSSFLVNPMGAVESIYHKRRLVIFGEYIPLVRWLPFLRWFTPVGEGFTPGDRAVQFTMTNPAVTLSSLICFEDVFPQEGRSHVTPDTDLLVNLTNDGWFDEGPEQRQHAEAAVFRAVENGVPLARCTNNGLTCWIDSLGRITQTFESKGSIYAAGFLTVEIPLKDKKSTSQTFYNRHGDWLPWSCCGLSLLCIFKRRETVSNVPTPGVK
jgi:apolipoprotein N-acyltransferase